MTQNGNPPSPLDLQTALFLLKELVDEQRRLHNKGITLETLHDQIQTVSSALRTILEEQTRLDGRLGRTKKRISDLEERVYSPEEKNHRQNTPLDDTGVHHDMRRAVELAELKIKLGEAEKKLEKESESATFWSRQKWLWVAAIVLAVIGTSMSACTGLVVWKITQGSVRTAP